MVMNRSDPAVPHSLSLDGDWQLHYAVDPAAPAATPAELFARSDYRRVAARVPGNVELDLVRSGELPEPYVGDGIRHAAPLELADWWLVRDVDWPGAEGDTVLRFEGLDTFAEVFCNDQSLGRAANMLIEHEFRAGTALRPGWNRIAVHLSSPLKAAAELPYSAGLVAHEERMEMLRVRKAPHGYGWDIAPRLLSAGIWRPAMIITRPERRIAEAYLSTRTITADEAELDLWFDLAGWPWAAAVELELVLTDPDGNVDTSRFPVHFRAGHQPVRVRRPRLWWPRGYGEPALYRAELKLIIDGSVVDARRFSVGIRTAELRRRAGSSRTPADADLVDPATGEDFRVMINGTEILCTGTNWVPVDALHSRDAERLPAALRLLDEVGGNLVRCWGGNVYESEDFFDFCDRTGLLIWQDFALACGITPQDDAFAGQLRTEADAVIKRLRQHPSLLLWCGNNENDMFWDQRGRDPGQDRISRIVLRDAVVAHDPDRPYLASSPFYTTRSMINGLPRAEEHLWGARASFKAPFYAAHASRFVSEIGYHGAPSVASMRLIDPGFTRFDPDDPVQQVHSTAMLPSRIGRSYNRIRLMLDQAALHVDFDPDRVEQVVQASQLTQAEAFKFFVESARVTPGRTGLIWWNLLDGWPQISDAVVGHDFATKLAFHHLRAAQQPIAVIAGEADGWQRTLHLVNHSRAAVRAKIMINDLDTGEPLWQGTAEAAAGAVTEAARLPIARGRDTMFALHWTGHATWPDAPDRPVAGANHYLDVAGRVRLVDYLRWLNAYAAATGLSLDPLWHAAPTEPEG